jgi:hypothetical protein
VRGTFLTRVLPVAAAAVLVAAAAAIAMVKHPLTLRAGTTAAAPLAASVSAVTRACPAPGLVGGPNTRVAFIAGLAGSGVAAGPGQAVISPLAAGGKPLATFAKPGTLTVTPVKSPRLPRHAAAPSPAPSGQPVATVPVQGGVVVHASGSMARGLETEQVASSGNASTRCESPGTDFWFVGPGRFSVGHIQLYLMNPGGEPADVNVEAFTDAGPLQGNTDTGVAVAPHAMVTQSLDTMLKGSRVVALHVRTSVGQITAALHDITGRKGSGGWLPAAQAPATQVVLPGMPATAGARQLYVAVPGTQDAHITLSVTTSRGTYQPTGGSGLDIPGGSAVAVALPSLGGVSGALRVAANVPVTATAMLPGGQPGTPGVFTAAAPAIQQQGVVAQSLTDRTRIAELVLTAPAGAVSARLVEIGAGGQPQPGTLVKIAAKHSTVVQLSRPAGTPRGVAFAVLITPLPGSGPLYAGRALAGSGKGGSLQSIVPVPSAPATVPLPAVRDAPITPGS